MKKRTIFVTGMLLFWAAGFFGAQAAWAADERPTAAQEPVLVATVNVEDAWISHQGIDGLKISFKLTNRTGIQPGVRYAVELRDDQGLVVDRNVYEESLDLAENIALDKEIGYVVPGYLSGKYQVWVVSQNEEGLPLAQALVGEINLAGSEEKIMVESDKCAFEVSGDSKSYDPLKGIDVLPEEELTLSCPVSSTFSGEKTIIPLVRTMLRSPFGRAVSEEKGSPLQLKAGEKKDWAVRIKKPTVPQAYDVTVLLTDERGETVGPIIGAHYVLRGESGTIQNFTLDKSGYSEGERLSFSLFWTGRADNFLDARHPAEVLDKISLQIAASSANGGACADNFSRELSREGLEKGEIRLKADCQGGKMVAKLLGSAGNILDEKTIVLGKTSGSAAISQEKEVRIVSVPYFLAFAIFVIGLLAIVLLWRRGGSQVGIFLLLLWTGVLFLGNAAEADTWFASYTVLMGGEGTQDVTTTYSANLGSATVCQNNNLSITGSASTTACSNTGPNLNILATVNGVSSHLVSNGVSQNLSMNVGSATGGKSARFDGTASHATGIASGSSSASHSISYSVNDCTPPTNGSCGWAAGKNFPVFPPSGQLCSSGTPGSYGNPPNIFVWTCYGDHGGRNASCNAGQILNGVCGVANGGSYVAASDFSGIERCNPGAVTNFSQNIDGFSWDCNGNVLGVDAHCSASRRNPGVTYTFGDGTTAPKTKPVESSGTALRWTPANATWCWGWSEYSSDGTTFSLTGEGWKNTNGGSEAVYPAQAGIYLYHIKCGIEGWKESAVRTLQLNITAGCTPATGCASVGVDGAVSCGNTAGLLVNAPWQFDQSCSGKCKCKCPDGFCRQGNACIDSGEERIRCATSTPSCGSQQCTSVTSPATCEVTNNCGTTYENPMNGQCRNGEECLDNTVACACPDGNWREVKP